METQCIFVDGEFYTKDDAKVSVFDHGYLYGDGVFEGIRFYNQRIFRLKEHMDRLYKSAKAIWLTVPLDYETFTNTVIESVKRSGLEDGYLRVIVSRGKGDLGLDPRKCPKATVAIIPSKLKMYPQELYDNGISLITVPTRRNVNEAINPKIKSLNYLNNILAKIEAAQAGYEEAIMLTDLGFVSECTGDNIFFVTKGKLFTPATFHGALSGITRQVVTELAEKRGLEVIKTTISRYDLYTSDECFLTGTGAEVIPVVKIDSREIGDGKPGLITLSLIKDFRELVRSEGVSAK
jgi:branched-chain amino acid aminotransferase